MRLETRLTRQERISRFLVAWMKAPADADIDVRIGRTEDGDPCVLVSIDDDHHPFTAAEADVVANAAEGSLKQFGEAAVAEGLDNLIIALRIGADASRRAALERERP